MPVPTLYDLAKTRLIQNIHMLEDIGDLPYSFLAPILKHIQMPNQLLELETNCPQIQGETGEIWLRFIKRDIPNWDKRPHQPRDEKNWSKVYRKLKKEAEREKEEQEEQLREQMRALQQNRAGNQTQIIEARVGYNPAARARGFGSRGGAWGSPAPPAKTGKAAFDKLRRGIFDQKQARPKATRMPQHLLDERKGKVAQAPARMVRMLENEGPSRMVVSKGASAGLPTKPNPHPTPQGKITSRPSLQATASSPVRPQRASLPAGQQFTAPKLRPQNTGPPPAQKRRREEPSAFMPKKRKI